MRAILGSLEKRLKRSFVAETGLAPKPLLTGYVLDKISRSNKPPPPPLDTIFDRGQFLGGFTRLVFDRVLQGLDRMQIGGSSKESNPLMAVFAPSGAGKTYSIGLLMELTIDLFEGGAKGDLARQYLRNEIGEKWGDRLADHLSDYVVIPITFNSRQSIYPGENIPRLMVLARILHCIVNSLSGKKVDIFEICDLILKVIPDGKIGGQIVYGILDLLFQGKGRERQVKYIFAIDEVMAINDPEVRTELLKFVCSLADDRPSSLVYSTSLDIVSFLKLATKSNRKVHLLPLTRCPSLILKNRKLMNLIRSNRVFVPVLFDLSAEPKQLGSSKVVTDLAGLATLSLAKIMKEVYKMEGALLSKMTIAALKTFVKVILDGDSVYYDKLVGEVELPGGNLERLELSNLFAYGMLVSLGTNETTLSPSSSLEFVPETLVPILVRAIKEVYLQCPITTPCAAFWALALCFVAPWVTEGSRSIDGEGFEMYFAINELLHRTTAFHGNDDYFATLADYDEESSMAVGLKDVYGHVENTAISEIPMTLHAVHRFASTTNLKDKKSIIGGILYDLQTTLGKRRFKMDVEGSLFSTQFLQFHCKDTDPPAAQKGVLAQLRDEDFMTFSQGGILLMNVPGGAGYDFVIADGDCLTFYEVKYTKPREAASPKTVPKVGMEAIRPAELQTNQEADIATEDTVSNVGAAARPKYNPQMLRSKQITEKHAECKNEFNSVKKRPGNVFKQWRLIFISYRDYRDVPRTDPANVHIFGPTDIAQMFPPTFLSRLEFSKYSNETEMLENYIKEMKQAIVKELKALDDLEAELAGSGEDEDTDVEDVGEQMEQFEIDDE